jgi:CRP-like cAMP-binding protein
MNKFIKKLSKKKKLGKAFKNKEYIYKEGDTADGIYFVCDGNVSITMKDRVITILDKGEIFGMMSLDKKESIRNTSAKAVGDSRVIKIERRKLIEKLHMDPSLAWKILNKTIDRLDMCETIFSNDFNIKDELEKNGDNRKWNLINWLKPIADKLKK